MNLLQRGPQMPVLQVFKFVFMKRNIYGFNILQYQQ